MSTFYATEGGTVRVVRAFRTKADRDSWVGHRAARTACSYAYARARWPDLVRAAKALLDYQESVGAL